MAADQCWKGRFIRALFPYSSKRLNIDKAFLIKQSHVPPYLYKYRSFSDSHKTALENNQLWMSAPSFFNDPYDTAIYFDPERFIVEDLTLVPPDQLASVLEEIKNGIVPTTAPSIVNPIQKKDLTAKLLAQYIPPSSTAEQRRKFADLLSQGAAEQAESIVKGMSNHIRAGFSVLSLTEVNTSVLMWSHYSSNHTGFCIEYDFSSLSTSDLRHRLCFPIFYRKKLTDATKYMQSGQTDGFNNLFAQFMSLIKSDEWSYESEWRILHALGASRANGPIDMPCPSSILLGAHTIARDEDWMKNFCRAHNIPLKKMKQRHDAFRLEAVDVAV